MSSLGNILPGLAGAAASMIPGVGPFVAPIAAQLVGQFTGDGQQQQQGGAPNPYAQIGGSLLSGAQSAQLAKQNQQTAQNIMNDALGKVSSERGNALGDFMSRAGQLTDPATQPHSAFTIDPRLFSGVRAPQVGSVFGSTLGAAPSMSYGPSSYYGDALRMAQQMLGGGGAGGGGGGGGVFTPSKPIGLPYDTTTPSAQRLTPDQRTAVGASIAALGGAAGPTIDPLAPNTPLGVLANGKSPRHSHDDNLSYLEDGTPYDPAMQPGYSSTNQNVPITNYALNFGSYA